MSTLLADTSGLDLSVLRAVNDLAKSSPGWLDTTVSLIGEYGILLGLAALCAVGWLQARRSPGGPVAVAAVLWAPLAAAVCELANLPISSIVDRPRPFVDHPGLDVLISGKAGTLSFVSDHSAMSMAIAIGLYLANRRLGLIAGVLALMQGFCRMFMGVHYPTDVIGGYALAAAVVLLLAPIAMAVLVPLCHSLARTKFGPLLVAATPQTTGGRRRGAEQGRRRRGTARPDEPAQDSDLAA
ncbi:phosphatase PAP2 family protein [Kitasatospora sp. MAP5-34]|uniref:phosphatase PAP2 family protein n=1 Tax=Kitasatospora sp. MAP5-34 TaxID=3035102 RepID=UPI0024764000|nr:phosphatase PAP2 family protein [Kitasatospora sp. MAP5-34]MDH6579574.1 undecaprenyl-diphosphatase [Kitasatospora sp. MAP5-34]